MKFTSIVAVVVAATVVSAETNGERLARGLHPMAPTRRGTPIARTCNISQNLRRSNNVSHRRQETHSFELS